MLRWFAVILALAVLTLASASLYRVLRPEPARFQPGIDPMAIVESFERANAPVREVVVRELYADRPELTDPRRTLPTWHEHPRAQAAAVFQATRQCPSAPLPVTLDDVALAKAYAWHARTCDGKEPPPVYMIDTPPFMHPSGESYAALGLALSHGGGYVAAHERAFHAIELSAVARLLASEDTRSVATLGDEGWAAILAGDRIVVVRDAMVRVVHDALGVRSLRFYARKPWDDALRRQGLSMVPARGSCARPASSSLCWEPASTGGTRDQTLATVSLASAVVALVSALALAWAYVVERRRAHADRLHVLRTLTHELRTPAASLLMDIEPLRQAYDELPESCQEPLLRLSDGVARLGRVLHLTGKFMALFEASRVRRADLLHPSTCASSRALMTELAQEWPDGVTLTPSEEDGAVETDPEWLGIAVRNLVENAVRHGTPPVVVSWLVDRDALVIRVRDAGRTPGFSMRNASRAFTRAPSSTGLGLGLAIVTKIAVLLGGSLSHACDPTTFELRVARRMRSRGVGP